MKILEPLQQALDLDVWTGILNQRESPTLSCAINRGGTKSLTAMGIGIWSMRGKGPIKPDEIAHKNVAQRCSLPGEPDCDPVLGGAGFYDAQFCNPRSRRHAPECRARHRGLKRRPCHARQHHQ